MASKTFIACFVCVLLSSAIALPLAHDSTSVRTSDSVHEKRLIESTSELGIVTALSHGEDSEHGITLVKSLKSVPALAAVEAESVRVSDKTLRRSKRKVIVGSGCPNGMIWFTKCMSYEEYELLMEADEFK